MYNINAITKLSDIELREGIELDVSWHNQYKGSSYVYFGGLSYDMSEGDVVVVFSQWGEPVDINLVRDKKTGKFKGFGFLAYEDQRSTVLAVDNANGMTLLGRRIRVNHVQSYRAPEKNAKRGSGSSVDAEATIDGEDKEEEIRVPVEATGAEGWGIDVVGVTASERALHGCGGKFHRVKIEARKRNSRSVETNESSKPNRKAIDSNSTVERRPSDVPLDAEEMWAHEFERFHKHEERKERKKLKKLKREVT